MGANEHPDDEMVAEPAEAETGQHAGAGADGAHPVPLFLRDGSDGRKGDAQDEKDEVGE